MFNDVLPARIFQFAEREIASSEGSFLSNFATNFGVVDNSEQIFYGACRLSGRVKQGTSTAHFADRQTGGDPKGMKIKWGSNI